MKNNFAPVILIAFNRPWHTEMTIKSLAKNSIASETEVYIYIDGPRNYKDTEKIQDVIDVVNKYKDFFKNYKVEIRSKNLGLFDNITNAVSSTLNHFESVIVLEDDIVTSSKFLEYMNCALDFYRKNHEVWHISGYSENISDTRFNDFYFTRLMHCWGWATWKDRWVYYEKNVDDLINSFNLQMIYNFNINGSNDFWSQVIDNRDGIINTWAIFWYATIFKNNGLCLNPFISYVENIGLDSSGEHSTYKISFNSNRKINDSVEYNFPVNFCEDRYALKCLTDFYSKKNYRLKKIIKYIYINAPIPIKKTILLTYQLYGKLIKRAHSLLY